MFLTRLCIRYPVFTVMMMLAFLVLGAFSWKKLAVEEYPNIEFPYVMITTTYPGASPIVVENEVTRPIEEAINSVAGVKRIISSSFDSQSRIAVEFSLNVLPQTAIQDVRDKIAAVKVGFREEVKEPLVERFRLEDTPVFSLAFISDDMTELSDHIEHNVLRHLQNIEGVGRIDLVGAQIREVHVYIQTEKLNALGVGIDEVILALRNDNIQIPAGLIRQGNSEKIVEISGKFPRPYDFAKVVVAQRGKNTITLGQLARIEESEAELQSLALLDGKRAISLNIIKSSGANLIALTDKIKSQLSVIEKELPVGAHMKIVSDGSTSIKDSLADVQKTLIEGAVLAVLIVFLFLGSWRSTVITGLTLPVALLGTLFFLYLFGLTLNTMTLMALSLSVGLLIDDAMVVRENIVRHAALGKDHKQAALEGTREIGLAVLATTLTIVAVFLPVAFMDGIIGRFFYQFGLAVSCAVLLSMLVSFTLDPMLSSRWHDPDAQGIQGQSFLAKLVRSFSNQLETLNLHYGRVLSWSLTHRKQVIALAVASLVLAFYTANWIGKEFVPEVDIGEISVKFSTPVGSSLAYTENKVKQINQILLSTEGIESSYATINTGMDIGKHKAALKVRLQDKNLRTKSQNEIINTVREKLSFVHGIQIDSVTPAKNTLGSLKPIQLSLQGNDKRELEKLAAEFEKNLNNIAGVIDVESSIKAERPTFSLSIDRERAADLGVSIGRIAMALRPLLAGEVVSSWQSPEGENYDVLVRLPENQRQNVIQLQNIGITSSVFNPVTGQPNIVTLGQVVDVAEGQSAAQINRRNLYAEVLFTANVQGRPAGDVGADIEKMAATMNWPAGYRLVTQGANKDMQESIGYAATALALGVIFIYMLLGTQFNSFLHPFTIMTSLPLSLVGVFLALWAWGSSLNMFSIIGIIMLMGLVTKNAILLVDRIQTLIQQGMEREEAIIDSGKTRLRPILMTSSAMIAGMIPLAIGMGSGAEQRAPMAHALIGGLITSTFLTLIVVPVVFCYLDDFKNSLFKKFKIKNPIKIARIDENIQPLCSEKPQGKDYPGMWYTARLHHGIDDRMLFGVYEKGQIYPCWYHASHRYYDGLGVLGDKLLPKYGAKLENGLPQGKDTKAPSLKQWLEAQKIPLVAPKASVLWRAVFPEKKLQAVPLPMTCLLSEAETQRIEQCAKLAGVSVTQWLLWAADQALRQVSLAPESINSWVYPVNLRGATQCLRESMNQCGGFIVTIAPNSTALTVQNQIRNRFARLEHWSQWWQLSIGRWVGQTGVNFIYRRLQQKPGQFVGSYTNLGDWQVPAIDGLVAAAPCSPSYPISVTTATCNGRRSLSVRVHPVVNEDGRAHKKALALWRMAALAMPAQAAA